LKMICPPNSGSSYEMNDILSELHEIMG